MFPQSLPQLWVLPQAHGEVDERDLILEQQVLRQISEICRKCEGSRNREIHRNLGVKASVQVYCRRELSQVSEAQS